MQILETYKGTLLLPSLLFVLALPVLAVPASPQLHEKTQPDGSKVNIRLKGDEFFNWKEDEEGYVVKKDEKDGFWKYAEPSKSKASFDIIPDAVLGKANPKALNLVKGKLPAMELIAEKIKNRWGEEYLGNLNLPVKKIEKDESSQKEEDSSGNSRRE